MINQIINSCSKKVVYNSMPRSKDKLRPKANKIKEIEFGNNKLNIMRKIKIKLILKIQKLKEIL